PPRIADRVRKKVLQDATQQGRIALHARLRSDHLEGKTALAGDRVEFLGEGRQYRVDAKGGESRPYGAAIEFRDIEQGAEKRLDRAQRCIDLVDQQVPPLVGQRRGKQARGVQRLQEIVAGRGEKAGLGQIGLLRFRLGG